MKLSEQQRKVFYYLLDHGRATVRELLPITNYPTCLIRDLKKKGIKIDKVAVPDTNYVEYFLETK